MMYERMTDDEYRAEMARCMSAATFPADVIGRLADAMVEVRRDKGEAIAGLIPGDYLRWKLICEGAPAMFETAG